jgi:NAD(P)-dependent dehydrogenase (short-subunit alcohol dehydrogenase family)
MNSSTERRLLNRTAVITGAGDGIGRAIARRYAREGANIVIADFNAEAGRQAAEEMISQFGVRAEFVPTDVCQKDQVERMIAIANEKFGGVDILVNNAWAGGEITRIENKSDEVMQRALTMALSAGVWAMKAVFPYMREKRCGRIINICSLNGVNAHMGTAEYNVGKEALRAYSRSAAREWAQHQINVNVICPAAVTSSFKEFQRMAPDMAAQSAAANPMGRMGDPDNDIAGVAYFLASDDSRYVTGNTLFVDGGSHINGATWVPEFSD